MNTILQIARALSDSNRVRALMLLQEGELCVCQIIEVLKLAPSTISQHMAILRQAGLVNSRKESRWIYFRLAGREAGKPVRDALKWLQTHSAQDATIMADQKTLTTILQIDREDLCKQQLKR